MECLSEGLKTVLGCLEQGDVVNAREIMRALVTLTEQPTGVYALTQPEIDLLSSIQNVRRVAASCGVGEAPR